MLALVNAHDIPKRGTALVDVHFFEGYSVLFKEFPSRIRVLTARPCIHHNTRWCHRYTSFCPKPCSGGPAVVRKDFPDSLTLIRKDAAPQALGTPEARSQTFELYDLAMIDKEIHFGTIILDVPGKNLRVRRFKHDLFSA